MADSSRDVYVSPPIENGAELLRRIGWYPSDMKQIEVYARMSPAQKVEQMLRLRGEHVRLLRARLRRDHSDYTENELNHLLQWHLDLAREAPDNG